MVAQIVSNLFHIYVIATVPFNVLQYFLIECVSGIFLKIIFFPNLLFQFQKKPGGKKIRCIGIAAIFYPIAEL